MKKLLFLFLLLTATFTMKAQTFWNTHQIFGIEEIFDTGWGVTTDLELYYPIIRYQDTMMIEIYTDTVQIHRLSSLYNDGVPTRVLWSDSQGNLKVSPIDSLPFVKKNGTTAQYIRGDGSLATFPTIPTNTNQLTNGAGFLTSEVDGSVSNELQTLSYSAGSLSISSGNSVSIPVFNPSAGVAQTRSLNSSFQPSTTSTTFVSYTVQVATTLSLSGGQSGTVILETSPNNSTWTEVSRLTNGNTGTLTVGLNITQTQAAPLTAVVFAGYYVRIRTVNNTGTPTFTFQSGNESTLN